MHPVATQFAVLRDELREQFQERDDAIDACLLAIACGEHVFLLGPPGTAKTQLIRAIMSAIREHRFFEVALSRNRPLEAVIGPLDILHFRATGEYRYRREGYATAAEYVLLNEVGKMSDDLGHDLLALTNERLIHEVRDVCSCDMCGGGGGSVHSAPLLTAFCDSNEELTMGSDDASALWDRLLVRDKIDYVVEDAAFVKVLKAGEPVITAEITLDELREVIFTQVPAVKIPDHVHEAMVKLRRELEQEQIRPSTRRFHWSMKVLQASAFLAGRDEVTTDDIANLRFTLWDTLDQIPKVDELCRSKANPFIGPLYDIRKRMNELRTSLEDRHKAFVDAGSDWDGQEGSALQMHGKEITQKLEKVRDELDNMLQEAAGRPIPTFKDISDMHVKLLIHNFKLSLDQDQKACEKLAEKRLGQGDGGNK